ncbi:MAG TPA: cupin domain-containing protein [Gammaproteobacteria bacterium]
MARHWQRRPLLVRAALPDFAAPLSRTELFALAARDDVESRLVRKTARGWSLVHGPFARSSLPPVRQRAWTLLVQGVDLHHAAAHDLLGRFRFVPDARLDDVMISWASDGGGVGPHVDSYDVFLLQARGRRRWRIARRFDAALDERAPLKVLRRFAAEEEYVLEPGDLLYLPPNWAHEGVAFGGDCMTCSIGMRAPQRGTLAGEIAQRLAETYDDATLYRDPQQRATASPAEIPPPLARFAADALQRLAAQPAAVSRALGEVLSDPKPHVWFTKRAAPWRPGAVALDRRTRMLYDSRHVYINGEAVAVSGHDAALLRALADERSLDARAARGASRFAQRLLKEWVAAGWIRSKR